VSGFRTEERGPALWVELDRPPLNVLDIGTIRALSEVVRELPYRKDLKVLVWCSALPGVFSAGVDVADHAPPRARDMLESFHGLFHRLDSLPQVTLAAVDGRCLGGGCELALFSDLVLATPASTFGQPEIDVGCFPPVAAVLLPRLIGRRAYEMVLLGDPIGAPEAERLGLVSRVVDDARAEAERQVARLAEKSGSVLALARRALRQSQTGSFGEKLARAEDLYREELLATRDAAEGVAAFLEKRPPRWSDA
jgi:cyclohexa-1,5-dienecarbonyl-CoA hydratase